MNVFHVVVWHRERKVFSTLRYVSVKDELTEHDLLTLEGYHADKSGGTIRVTTDIISWQKLAEIPKGR